MRKRTAAQACKRNRGRRTIAATLIAAATMAGTVAHASKASAGWWAHVWEPLGVGCARQIAVGPNGHPWITGCPGGNPNATGPAWVYYLTWGADTLLGPTPVWNYDNFSAININVNINGWIFASDSTGAIYQDIANNAGYTGYYELPSGVWAKVADPAPDSFAVTVQTSALQPAGEMFYPAQYLYGDPAWLQGDDNGNINIWCNGFGGRNPSSGPFSGPDESLYVMQSHNIVMKPAQMTSWSRLPGAAVQVAMVTTPGGSSEYATDVEQTPWVVNAEGGVYYFSAGDGQNATYGHYGQWVKIKSPAPALYVTDGFILTTDGVYFTNSDTNGSQWEPFIGDPEVNGSPVKLKQIAAGGSIPNAVTGGTPGWGMISDPTLWGLDYEGRVYQETYKYFSGVPIQ